MFSIILILEGSEEKTKTVKQNHKETPSSTLPSRKCLLPFFLSVELNILTAVVTYFVSCNDLIYFTGFTGKGEIIATISNSWII